MSFTDMSSLACVVIFFSGMVCAILIQGIMSSISVKIF